MAEMTALARPALLRALGWQAAAGLLFVGMTAAVKFAGEGLPPVQSAFLRFALGLVFLIPLVPQLLSTKMSLRTASFLGLRGALHSAAVVLWFLALTLIPLAEVTAMNYLSPVYVMLGAALFLGEKLEARRALAVVVAILGMLVVLRPGFREITTGHFAMLGMTILMASTYLIAKTLTKVMSATHMVAWLSILVSVFLAPFAIWVWVPASPMVWAVHFLSAAFGTAAHYCMTRSFASAPMQVTQPVSFLQLIWSVLLGLFAFGEGLDLMVLLGAALIFGAVCWSSFGAKRAGA